ncbi:restriction endonuclease FokI C-terminal domain-containing protein [Clostridium sporogenes]|uniref:restriction endonuclease FokI C-terminal domain-containing protein n=1 Tax=Clostridium sporogenes TaxID=1509 RepID=UPI00313BABB7
MINYWWVTRPKRKLNTIPEVLSTFAEISLNEEWQGQRDTHLTLEEALEQAGLKRIGERRDQTGGGARTYRAWVASLGLIFTQESTKQTKLTLAGEAIMKGDSPVEVLKHQILKYQFPSYFSTSRGVKVSSRFKIRPFRFLLRLLSDSRLEYYLTEEEIAKIVIVEADKETEKCYNYVVDKINKFRNYGDTCLEEDFNTKYGPSKGKVNSEHPYSHLLDVANTIINWLEYTQLAKRNEEKQLVILDDKQSEVAEILATTPNFIDRPEKQEYFQRKFGVDPKHSKDTRNLTEAKTITYKIIAEQKIKQIFIAESLKKPIGKITPALVDKIIEQTGIDVKFVEETLLKYYPHGAIGSFMTEYFEMAFRGRDDATEFELATVELFKSAFGFETEHVGPIGLTPDVLILSNEDDYIGIIDNKAYSKYTISNDHKNRMIHNYIKTYKQGQKHPLAFFSYIAGGFGKNIDNQIKEIVDETKINGSAISVTNVIKLVEYYNTKNYDHRKISDIFSVDRQVLMSDL